MATKKIRGIYLRGNVYWFTHGSGKRRIHVSLETSDYAEPVQKAQELIDNPLLNTTTGFKVELDAFADFKPHPTSGTKKPQIEILHPNDVWRRSGLSILAQDHHCGNSKMV